MNIFKFDPNNTEGAWSTAMVVEGAEIKKGDKIVATDIVDLYDTDISNPQDKELFIYATNWINGEASGGGECNVFSGYIGYEDGPVEIRSFAAGSGFSIIILTDGTLWGAGDAYVGQLGANTPDPYYSQVFIQESRGDTDWVKVACGDSYTMALKSNGTLWATGSESYGEMGLNEGNSTHYSFQEVPKSASMIFLDVACGRNHTVAIMMMDDGGEPQELWTCGNNAYGQLGTGEYGNHEDEFTWITIPSGSEGAYEVNKIACGSYHSTMIRNDGQFLSCGYNNRGQLGLYDNENRSTLEAFDGWSNFEDIACGEYHTMALRFSSLTGLASLWGTGDGTYGQLGNGSSGTTSFVQSGSNERYSRVACGLRHTLAINDGDLWAAGATSSGQTGTESLPINRNMVLVDDVNSWINIAGGDFHSLATKNNYLHSTGRGSSGQLGLDDFNSRYEFTQVIMPFPVPGFVYINENTGTPGYGQYNTPFLSLKDCFEWLRQTCAVISPEITILLLSDININDETSLNHPYGDMLTIDGNYHTIFFDYDVIMSSDPTITGTENILKIFDNNSISLQNVNIDFDITDDGDEYVNEGKFINIEGGYNHSLAINSEGEILGTGYNSVGQLGLGPVGNQTNFTQEIRLDNNWVDIGCGIDHSLAIKTNGTLWATGSNDYGQLGLGNEGNKNTFTQVGTNTDWAEVTCGIYHSLVIKTNGTLWATGRNDYGQLGLEDEDNKDTFIQVGTDTDWKQIKGALYHSIALKNDGTVWSTGYNEHGELSLGNNGAGTNKNTFTQEIGLDTDWEKIGCGVYHSVAIKSDGTLWTTGYNGMGQLGLGNYGAGTDKNTFTQEIGLDTDWEKIGCGGYFTFAIKTNGNAWATGNNNYGELGLYSLGHGYDKDIFTKVGSSSDYDIIECGVAFTITLKTNNRIWATGQNNLGQIGLDGILNRDSFEFVIGGIFVGGWYIYDGYYEETYEDINNFEITNNSSLSLNNVTLLNPEEHIVVKLDMGIEGFYIMHISKNPFNFYKSVGVLEGNIPNNVNINIRSTVQMPDLQQDIVNWTTKNDSLVVITDESSHSIDVTNENSMVVVNDAQL